MTIPGRRFCSTCLRQAYIPRSWSRMSCQIERKGSLSRTTTSPELHWPQVASHTHPASLTDGELVLAEVDVGDDGGILLVRRVFNRSRSPLPRPYERREPVVQLPVALNEDELEVAHSLALRLARLSECYSGRYDADDERYPCFHVAHHSR